MGLLAIDVATAAIWRIALPVALAALIGGCGQAIDSAASLRGPLCVWLESSARDIGSDESQPVEIKARCLPRGRGTSLGMIDEMLFPRSLNVTRSQVEWLEVVSEEKMAVVYSSRTGASPLLWQLPANYAWGTPPAMDARSIVRCFAKDPVSSCRSSPLAGTSLSVHSLTTGGDVVVCKEGQLCSRRSQVRPVVSADWVVWQDHRNKAASGSDIYAFHLASGKEYAVCTDPGDQSYPAVSGR